MAHEIIYTVTGSWPFPLDMLRYDQSRAATDEDQAKIDALSGEYAPSLETIRVPVSISLIMVGHSKHARPTTARWESFTWHVPTDRDFYADRLQQKQRKQRDVLVKTALSKLSPAEREAVEQRMEGP